MRHCTMRNSKNDRGRQFNHSIETGATIFVVAPVAYTIYTEIYFRNFHSISRV